MKIYCKNTESFFDADPGVTFQELFNQVDIVGNPLCKFNGKLTRICAVYENMMSNLWMVHDLNTCIHLRFLSFRKLS